MHIPDGTLSPQTYLPAWAVMAPLWVVAGRRLKRVLRVRRPSGGGPHIHPHTHLHEHAE